MARLEGWAACLECAAHPSRQRFALPQDEVCFVDVPFTA